MKKTPSWSWQRPVIALAIAGVAIGAWWMFQEQPPVNPTVGKANDEIVVNAGDVAGDGTDIPADGEAVEVEEPQAKFAPGDPEYDAAKKRDDQRLEDVQNIMAALEEYRKATDSYPVTFDDLVSRYINKLPQDPGDGSTPYEYTPIGRAPYNFYSVTYTLEIGTDEIVPGFHEATPDGIASL